MKRILILAAMLAATNVQAGLIDVADNTNAHKERGACP